MIIRKTAGVVAAISGALVAGSAAAGSWVPVDASRGDSGGEALIIMLAIGAFLILNGTRNSNGRAKQAEPEAQDSDDDVIMRF